MPQSKADKLAAFIERLIREEVADMLLDRSTPGDQVPEINVVNHDQRRRLSFGVGCRLRDPYRWKELTDIMAWKKPREAQ